MGVIFFTNIELGVSNCSVVLVLQDTVFFVSKDFLLNAEHKSINPFTSLNLKVPKMFLHKFLRGVEVRVIKWKQFENSFNLSLTRKNSFSVRFPSPSMSIR